MTQFFLILHENPATYANYSPAELQALVERYSAWGESIAAKGQMAGGHKLTDDGGRHLKRAKGGALAVTDGPYNETKEVIGGVFIVNAPSYDAAVAIAGTCPHLDNGWIEVRQIEVMNA